MTDTKFVKDLREFIENLDNYVGGKEASEIPNNAKNLIPKMHGMLRQCQTIIGNNVREFTEPNATIDLPSYNLEGILKLATIAIDSNKMMMSNVAYDMALDRAEGHTLSEKETKQVETSLQKTYQLYNDLMANRFDHFNSHYRIFMARMISMLSALDFKNNPTELDKEKAIICLLSMHLCAEATLNDLVSLVLVGAKRMIETGNKTFLPEETMEIISSIEKYLKD